MPRVKINKNKCKGCLLCISVCPKKLITLSGHLNTRGVRPVEVNSQATCIGCKMCTTICPDCCIEIFK